MKIQKKSKKHLDITKIDTVVLEEELNRRSLELERLSRENHIKELYELYKKRETCPILGRAYLPANFEINYWDGISNYKEFDVAGIKFGTDSFKFTIRMTEAAADSIKAMISDNDPILMEFWNSMRMSFNKIVENLIKDPARIAVMIAHNTENFWVEESTATQIEIEYYNKIIDLFVKGIVERFQEYHNLDILNAIDRLVNRDISVGFSGDIDAGVDILKIVMNHRGYKYLLTSYQFQGLEENNNEN